MESITFDTNITTPVMYRYLMKHTYSSPMGVVGVIAGLVLIAGFLRDMSSPLYLIGGIFVLAYLPFTLYTTAARQVRLNPAFKKPLTYTLTEEDITISQDDQTRTVTWDTVYKTVFSKSLIIVYTSRVNAWIFPRADLGDKEQAVEALIKRKTAVKV